MDCTLDEFIETLAQSGLMSADEVRLFLGRLPQEPLDGYELSRELVRAGRLTVYQAALLGQGQSQGLVVGPYEVLDKIGAGGMGQVFKARHRHMKRIVALKVLPPSATDWPELVRRFQREVEAAARLQHPNIVMAHDAGEANGIHFLIMEYVDGIDLAALVRSRGPLPAGAAVHYLLQAARALEYAHSQGIIHRDVKPSNLLLDRAGIVKVLDLGVARLDDGDILRESLTETGQIMGSVDYMAPEQAADTRKADRRSDIYSLGCTLYFLLANRPIFDGDTTLQRLLAHRELPVPDLRAVRTDLLEALQAVFARMVAKKPEDRQASMKQVIGELEEFADAAVPLPVMPPPGETNDFDSGPELGQRDIATHPLQPQSERKRKTHIARATRLRQPTRQARRWPWVLAGGAAPLLVVSIVAAVMLWRAPAETPTSPGSKPIDLLPLVDVRLGSPGCWRFDSAVLMGQGGGTPPEWGVLPIPYAPPPEYVFEAVVERVSGDHCFALGLAAEGRQFNAGIDVGHGEFTELADLDHRPPGMNETARRGSVLTNNRRHTIRCEVRKSGVKLSCDGQQLIDYHGGYQRLSLIPVLTLPDPRCLFLIAIDSTFRIHQLELTPLSGQGERLRLPGMDGNK